MKSGKAYTPDGSEMKSKGAVSKTPVLNKMKFVLDGKDVELTAYTIDGNNYLKLRDMAVTFNFFVDYDGSIIIDTTRNYIAPIPTPAPEAQTEEPKKDTSTTNRTVGILLEGNNSVVTELASEDSQVSKNDKVLAGYVGSPAEKVMLGFETDTNYFFASLLQGLLGDKYNPGQMKLLKTMLTAYCSDSDATKIIALVQAYLDDLYALQEGKYKDCYDDGVWIGTDEKRVEYRAELSVIKVKHKITQKQNGDPRVYRKVGSVEVALEQETGIFNVIIK